MKILLIGRHANSDFYRQRLLQDNSVDQVHHIPSVFQPTGRYFSNKDESYSGIINYIKSNKFDIAVAANKIDGKIVKFLYDSNIPTLGPISEYSDLESSKIKGKTLLNHLGIPTPGYRTLSRRELLHSFHDIPRPWVLKYVNEWRAGLQSVIINDDNYLKEFEEFKVYGGHSFSEVDRPLIEEDRSFVIEDFLNIKKEYSYHIIANNTGWTYLGSARDYKKFYNNDLGFNTAGMGCYSQVDINPKVHDYADSIIKHLMVKQPYIGILYLGIAEDFNGLPYVLELNTRGGDPEMQSILLTHKPTQSLAKIFYQTANGQSIDPIEFDDCSAVSIRIVRTNYREVVNNYSIKNLDGIKKNILPDLYPEVPGIYISRGFNTGLLGMTISTKGDSRIQASNKLYKFLSNKNLYDFTCRTDIGYLE